MGDGWWLWCTVNDYRRRRIEDASHSALSDAWGSFRGPGLEGGLKVLAEVKRQIGVPVVTDVHEIDQIKPVAEVVDVLQTPAFLCRQTDFINAVAASGRPVNIKKGQFLAPHDMMQVVAKARAAARDAGVDEDCVMARGWPFSATGTRASPVVPSSSWWIWQPARC